MTPFVHEFYVNLRTGAAYERAKKPLSQGNALADKIVVHVQDCGKDVDLSGMGVSALVVRFDGQTVPLTGTVENGAACITLDKDSYAVPGEARVTVMLSAGEMVQTVLVLLLTIDTSQTSVVVDNGVIGDLSELLGAIAEMRSATDDAQAAAESVKAFKAEVKAEIDTLATETGLKRESGTELVLLYDYMNSYAADNITQNADGKVYVSTGKLTSTSGSTSYSMPVSAGDVYLLTGRLSSYYIILFSGDVVHTAYNIAAIGAEIMASGQGEYRESNKAFTNWRLTIPDGVDSIGVTVATYASYVATLYKEEAGIEYINVADVKEKAEAAYDHTVMPVATMPTYLQNALAYKPLGALSKPYICLSTDDGREGLIHQTIEMVVDVAHVPVTFCIHSNSDIFYEQKRKKYTLAQVAEKINSAIVDEGCELALHDNKIWADMSGDKQTPYTEQTLYEFVQSEKAFIANPREIDTSTELGVSWAYKSASAPEHATDAVVSLVMGGEFGVLRSGDTNLGLIKNIYDYKCLGARSNLFCLTAKNFNSGMYNTLAKAKAAVDYAVEHNLVLSIFWHEAIMASADEESSANEHITDDQINNILLPMIEYAKSKGVEFVTLSQIPYLQ